MVLPKAACHNCRRRRLKCDRSLPQCLKCIKNGHECLGYGRLFRWEQGVASRGKMMGVRFDDANARIERAARTRALQLPSPPSSDSSQCCSSVVSSPRSLTDPLIQDVGLNERRYLFYFASGVCKDLILYDSPESNPFRNLIPMTQQHPLLLQVIVASSAIHMSNATDKGSAFTEAVFSPQHSRSNPISPTPDRSGALQRHSDSYSDALAAKQRALRLLRSSLTDLASVNVDVTLAAVLLFVDFELIDSGRENWRHHVNGARSLIEKMCASKDVLAGMSPLRKCLIENCLVFDILGSTIGLKPCSSFSTGTSRALLRDTEGNHCSLFPVVLLELIQEAADITSKPPSIGLRQELRQLLQAAESFDPHGWAENLKHPGPPSDLENRVHVATAHQAAVYVYLYRILQPFLQPHCHDLEPLVSSILFQLSFIQPGDPLFKATPWPTFIAGAETKNGENREWISRRFRELWEAEPWGLLLNALSALEDIWATDDDDFSNDWIGRLRRQGIDWIII